MRTSVDPQLIHTSWLYNVTYFYLVKFKSHHWKKMVPFFRSHSLPWVNTAMYKMFNGLTSIPKFGEHAHPLTGRFASFFFCVKQLKQIQTGHPTKQVRAINRVPQMKLVKLTKIIKNKMTWNSTPLKKVKTGKTTHTNNTA